jgi:hypothetical protein
LNIVNKLGLEQYRDPLIRALSASRQMQNLGDVHAPCKQYLVDYIYHQLNQRYSRDFHKIEDVPEKSTYLILDTAKTNSGTFY